MKQILSGLIISFSLLACSTTRIHLFTQGVESSELYSISASLKEKGFRVHLVDLQPPDLSNAAIIYSPAHPHIDDLEKISATLFELGYKEIDLIAVSKDNQSYTGRNVGLYFSGGGASRKFEAAEKQMPTEFAGHCHSTDAYLKLYEKGNFDLTIISWDESDTEHTSVLSGRWKSHGENLELFFSESKSSVFLIEKTDRTDQHNNFYRKIQLTSIKPTNVLTGCQFTSTMVSAK